MPAEIGRSYCAFCGNHYTAIPRCLKCYHHKVEPGLTLDQRVSDLNKSTEAISRQVDRLDESATLCYEGLQTKVEALEGRIKKLEGGE